MLMHGRRIIAGQSGEFRQEAHHLLAQVTERSAFVTRDFAEHEIVRLNAVGAFINRQHPRIAHMLRYAGFFYIAHAAGYLHGDGCHFIRKIGQPAFDDGRQQIDARRARFFSALRPSRDS